MDLKLSSEERNALAEMLDEQYRRLEIQIIRADGFEFRRMLRHREQLLESMIGKLGVA